MTEPQPQPQEFYVVVTTTKPLHLTERTVAAALRKAGLDFTIRTDYVGN